MSTETNNTRCKVKPGWANADREGVILHSTTSNGLLNQSWSMVLWDGDEDPDCFKTAGLVLLPRTKELDYDARPKPKTNRSCVRCQRDIKPGSPVRTVHVVEGGSMILHPADEHLYTSDKGDCGMFEVGIDCARVIGMEWMQ